MTICNKQIETVLQKATLETIKCDHSYPITEKTTVAGEPYWSVGVIEENALLQFAGVQLTDHEWNINEVYLCDSESVTELVTKGLRIVKAWKSQMNEHWSSVLFDVLLSVDYGDNEIRPSVTLRFWAVRNDYHYILPQKENLEMFKTNAVMIECVNYAK